MIGLEGRRVELGVAVLVMSRLWLGRGVPLAVEAAGQGAQRLASRALS